MRAGPILVWEGAMGTLQLSDEVELGEYVTQRIGQIFTDLAEDLSQEDLPPDMAAGVPMALFKAELYLKGAWLAYIERGES
jgi:hypothetical protein